MHSATKGFLFRLKFFRLTVFGKSLIKQVLTPPLVAMTDQTHELPGGMQRERPRPARQFKSGLFRCAGSLAVVAVVAASDQILPGRTAAPRTRHYVVQGKFRSWKN